VEQKLRHSFDEGYLTELQTVVNMCAIYISNDSFGLVGWVYVDRWELVIVGCSFSDE